MQNNTTANKDTSNWMESDGIRTCVHELLLLLENVFKKIATAYNIIIRSREKKICKLSTQGDIKNREKLDCWSIE